MQTAEENLVEGTRIFKTLSYTNVRLVFLPVSFSYIAAAFLLANRNIEITEHFAIEFFSAIFSLPMIYEMNRSLSLQQPIRINLLRSFCESKFWWFVLISVIFIIIHLVYFGSYIIASILCSTGTVLGCIAGIIMFSLLLYFFEKFLKLVLKITMQTMAIFHTTDEMQLDTKIVESINQYKWVFLRMIGLSLLVSGIIFGGIYVLFYYFLSVVTYFLEQRVSVPLAIDLTDIMAIKAEIVLNYLLYQWYGCVFYCLYKDMVRARV